MPECAIYLDARERDLARRVCWLVPKQLGTLGGLSVDHFAYDWTRDEVLALRKKFEERPPPAAGEKGAEDG